MTRKGLGEFLPTSVQKSYFMLSDAERKVLSSALEKYRPGQSEPILVGGENLLKPALQLTKALRTAKQNPGKYRSLEAQVANAFRSTGAVTFAVTQVGEVKADSKLFKPAISTAGGDSFLLCVVCS